MLRLALAIVLVGALLTTATLLHMLTTAYLLGLVSGVWLTVVWWWVKGRRRKGN